MTAYDKLLEMIQKNYPEKKQGEFDDFYYGDGHTWMLTHVRGNAADCGVTPEKFNVTQILLFNKDNESIVVAEKTK